MTTSLFTPYTLGALELPHRVLMAPMTRNRAGAEGVPTALNAEYYRQRAGAGLIITEGTQPSAAGQAYPGTPGLHDDAQQRGWEPVIEAVHDARGRIFIQLMHGGRISHPLLQPGGARPVAPSAVKPAGEVFIGAGMVPFVTPRELRREELAVVREQFVAAARRAIAAGADGVELHAANGYLLHQFLSARTNRRGDDYGGASIANRIRFVVEVAAAVSAAIGGDRVGVRISPGGTFNDMDEPDAIATYTVLLQSLGWLGLAYVHVIESADAGFSAVDVTRGAWRGTLIANGVDAEVALAAGRADLVSFGRAFLANPDLPERLRAGAPLNAADPDTFYGGEARGYVDYPVLAEAVA